MKNELEIDQFGNKKWYKNGLLHREDGPAYIDADGMKYWYKNGLLHRENGPAIEFGYSIREWWLNGASYEPTEHIKKLYEAGNL